MVAEYLAGHGFAVVTRARRGERAARRWQPARSTRVILDVMLPDARRLRGVPAGARADSDVPILMLTARGDETDRIVGLELGADDYLPKPFNPRELLARLRAILRRRDAARDARRAMLRFGRLEIDRDARVVRVDGSERALTGYQFDLLWRWRDNAGRVLSRETLMDGCAARRSRRSTAASTCTSRASAPRSRTTRSIRAASSPCAARATCSREPGRGRGPMRRLYLQVYLAFVGVVLLFAALVALAWWLFADDGREERRWMGWPLCSRESLPTPGASGRAAAQARGVWRRGSTPTSRCGRPDGALLAAAGEPLDPASTGRTRAAGCADAADPSMSRCTCRTAAGCWRAPPSTPRAGLLLALLPLAAAVAARRISVSRAASRGGSSGCRRGSTRSARADLQARVEVEGRDEVAELARSFNRAAERIGQLVAASEDAAGACVARAAHPARADAHGARAAPRRRASRAARPG